MVFASGPSSARPLSVSARRRAAVVWQTNMKSGKERAHTSDGTSAARHLRYDCDSISRHRSLAHLSNRNLACAFRPFKDVAAQWQAVSLASGFEMAGEFPLVRVD